MYKISNPESFRQNVVTKFLVILGDERTTTNLEKGVYNYAIKEAGNRKIIKKWDNPHFTQIYTDRLRSIFINLKNPDLLQQIKSGEITPQNLAFMTHQEMNPQAWHKLIDEKIKRDANKYSNNLKRRLICLLARNAAVNDVHITSYKLDRRMNQLLSLLRVWIVVKTGKPKALLNLLISNTLLLH